MRYRFGGLIFGGAYFRNFTVVSQTTGEPSELFGDRDVTRDMQSFTVFRNSVACVTAGPGPPTRLGLRKHPYVPSGEERGETDAFAGYTRLNHLYSPSEEGLESLRRRQVTPALGLIQVVSGVGEGLWASDR